MRKSQMKQKSLRNPFRDVSNRITGPSKSTAKKATSESKADLHQEYAIDRRPSKSTAKKPTSELKADLHQEDAIDRLLLVHSDISNILRQIDELVVQAVQAKETNSQQKKEIVSLTNALSETLSSLKPWVPRFQEAFSGLSTEAKDQPAQASTSTRTCPTEDDGNDIVFQSPEITKLDLLVSPSPLVSWRAADCTVEWGKQLFALTPLPKPKTTITKSQPLSKSVALERPASSNTTSRFPSRFTVVFQPKNDSPEKLTKISTTENLAPASRCKEPSTDEFSSPAKSTVKGLCSTTIQATPCLKVSPPKSCILLEPNHERSNKRDFFRFRKSTPFPCGTQKLDEQEDDFETSSGSEPSEEPGLKFTNLLGLKPASEFSKAKKDVYALPAWCRSPPRSCTLMEPTEEFDPLNFSSLEEFASSAKHKNDTALQRIGQPRAQRISLTLNTPIWKEPNSTAQRTRPPGEFTLKKELWMKFEAASMGGCSLKLPVLEEEETCQAKGFLDRLEEEAL